MSGNSGGPWGGGGNRGGGGRGSGGGQGPGNQGPQIPEIDDLVKKGQQQLKVLMGGRGGGGGRGGSGGPGISGRGVMLGIAGLRGPVALRLVLHRPPRGTLGRAAVRVRNTASASRA
jgi:modulator of FtsH protease HflK